MNNPRWPAACWKTQRESVAETARFIREQGCNHVLIVARGTSDNAGRYAKYLWGSMNGLLVSLAAPSLFTMYHMPPNLADTLVVGISQSGQSPDIVAVLQEAKSQGCPTVVITNAPDSPLAQQADRVVDVCAGEEKAVAATKSYDAQVMAVAMLSAAMREDAEMQAALEKVPGWIEAVLEKDGEIARLAQRYTYMDTCAVVSRGYNYGSAFEWALKMKEMAYVVADPYSTADFLHGPIAVVERGFPVMVIAPSGVMYADLKELARKLHEETRADVLAISDNPELADSATSFIQLPAGIPEWLSPVVSIVPAQIFAYYLTRAKALDTESPRGLKKVTETY